MNMTLRSKQCALQIISLLKKYWECWLVILFSLLASWWYFVGTPFVLGLDYFQHLAHSHSIKLAMEEGNPIPAYTFLCGCGSVLIRYQGMLVAQLMAWLCFFLEKMPDVTPIAALMYTGRLTCILINVLAGLSFYYGLKRWIPCRTALLVGTVAYLFGWPRLGEVLHVGALERAGAMIFYPLCFSLFCRSTLSRKEQMVLGASWAGCLLCHPASFVLLMVVLIAYKGIRILWSALGQPWQQWACPKNRERLRAHLSTCAVAGLTFLALSAWYVLPFLYEKGYYGQYRYIQSQPQPQKAWSQLLPLKYLREFVDQQAWFGNLTTDAAHGGSYLGDQTGVNSAYCGIAVLLLCGISLFLNGLERPYRIFAYQINLCALIILGLIWGEGIRHHLFFGLGHHILLPCRWLASFYFLLCVSASCGAWATFAWIQRLIPARKGLPHCILLAVAFLIALDFCLLIDKCGIYEPQQGVCSPLGVGKIHYAFDGYDVLLKNKEPGKVLDLPQVSLHSNRIYHQRPDPFPIESTTAWTEANSYDQMIMEEVNALLSRPYLNRLKYMNCHRLYDIGKENLSYDDRHLTFSEQEELVSRPGWQGETEIKIHFPLPVRDCETLMAFPLYLPPSSEFSFFVGDIKKSHLIGWLHREKNFVIIPFEKHVDTLSLKWHLLHRVPNDSVKIGKAVLFYDDHSFAQRLSLLDIRFIVINRGYSSIPPLRGNEDISCVHYSPTSLVYENRLSKFLFLPDKTYSIQGERPWEFFNQNIAHHPRYDPNLAGFCYEGGCADFDGILLTSSRQWKSELDNIFTAPVAPPTEKVRMIEQTMESVSFEVDIGRERFFFPAMRYHPNLKAVAGDREIKTYLAQAGMLAAKLPVGKYRLRIYYHHAWYDVLGKVISAAAVLFFLGKGLASLL